MKLYLAGPMSLYKDDPDDPYGFKRFHAAAACLRTAQYEVLSPAEAEYNEDLTRPWNYYVREGIKLLMDCDGVALMARWDESDGAKIERQVANMLNIPSMKVDAWIDAMYSPRLMR